MVANWASTPRRARRSLILSLGSTWINASITFRHHFKLGSTHINTCITCDILGIMDWFPTCFLMVQIHWELLIPNTSSCRDISMMNLGWTCWVVPNYVAEVQCRDTVEVTSLFLCDSSGAFVRFERVDHTYIRKGTRTRTRTTATAPLTVRF